LEDLVKKRDSYATDLEQFHDLIDQMDQHVAKLKQKKSDQSAELEETNKKLATMASKVEKLEVTIKEQEFSVEDVQKMETERKGFEEAIERSQKLRDQRRSALWEIESELEKYSNNVESLISDYNLLVSDLKLLPIVSSKGIDMAVAMKKDATSDANPSRMLSVDLPGTIQPLLKSCLEEYSTMITESKSKYQEALDKLEKSEELFTETLERNRIVENRIDKCEGTMEAEREAQEAKIGVRIKELESIETKVASLRDPVALEEQMAKFEQQCAELEVLRQQLEEDNVNRKAEVCEEINQALLAMQELDAFYLDKISEVQKYKANSQSTYGKLEIPKVMQSTEGSEN